MIKSTDDVKIYFVTIPAHKFLHIKNYESNGYWDFWQKQTLIPGQDCETICGLLDSIKGKLDDDGGSESTAAAARSWLISMIRMADSVIGVFRAQSVMAYVFLLTTTVKFRRRCLWMMFPKLNILFLNTDPLIMNRKTAAWKKRLKRQWPPLILRTPVTAMIHLPEESYIFIIIPNISLSISDR